LPTKSNPFPNQIPTVRGARWGSGRGNGRRPNTECRRLSIVAMG
jgi:hypothetical protein